MALSPCKQCGRLLSWEETVCPHCGTRDPVVHPWMEGGRPTRGASLAAAILIGGLLLAAAAIGALAVLDWLPLLPGGAAP